jgi:Flp pilus assembly protein TadD
MLLEPDTESARACAFPGARQSALTYPETIADPDDEFLGWFLKITRPWTDGARMAGPPASEGAIAGLSGQMPWLPDPEAVRRAAVEWANGDRHLSSLLSGGVPASRALARWGMSLLQSNQIPLAVAAFRASVALAPRDPVAWSNYGVALDLAHSPSEACTCIERSLFLSAHQPQTWLRLGMIRNKLEDCAGAESAYRTALEQDPADAYAWQCLGFLKEEQADLPGAIDCYAASIERGGGGPAVSANLGMLCYRIGRFVEAQKAYAEAVEGEPDNTEFQLMLRKLTSLRNVREGGSADAAGYRASFN